MKDTFHLPLQMYVPHFSTLLYLPKKLTFIDIIALGPLTSAWFWTMYVCVYVLVGDRLVGRNGHWQTRVWFGERVYVHLSSLPPQLAPCLAVNPSVVVVLYL